MSLYHWFLGSLPSYGELTPHLLCLCLCPQPLCASACSPAFSSFTSQHCPLRGQTERLLFSMLVLSGSWLRSTATFPHADLGYMLFSLPIIPAEISGSLASLSGLLNADSCFKNTCQMQENMLLQLTVFCCCNIVVNILFYGSVFIPKAKIVITSISNLCFLCMYVSFEP